MQEHESSFITVHSQHNIESLGKNDEYDLLPFPLEVLGNKMYVYKDHNSKICNCKLAERRILVGVRPSGIRVGEPAQVVTRVSLPRKNFDDGKITYKHYEFALPLYVVANKWLIGEEQEVVSVENVNAAVSLFNRLVSQALYGDLESAAGVWCFPCSSWEN
jgi:hypothetical protein